MSSFFRKRPPYVLREAPAKQTTQEDFPSVSPATEDVIADDYPVVSPSEAVEDFPIVGPADEDALDDFDVEIPTLSPAAAEVEADSKAIAVEPAPMPAASTKRTFQPSNKLRLAEAPAWVQAQAKQAAELSLSASDATNRSNHTPLQLQNAIQVIINNEMAEAEKRIKQKVLAELASYFENR